MKKKLEFAAIIGLIASVLGIIAFITGKDLPDIFGHDEPPNIEAPLNQSTSNGSIITVEGDNNEVNVNSDKITIVNTESYKPTTTGVENPNKKFIEEVPTEKKKATYIDTFNGQEYAIYDIGYNWDISKKFCEEYNGHLVTIESQEEQNFIESLLRYGKRRFYFIGGKRMDNKKEEWEWVTGEEFDYVNWGNNEPNNTAECFSIIDNDEEFGKWNDVVNKVRYGEAKYGFIFESNKK